MPRRIELVLAPQRRHRYRSPEPDSCLRVIFGSRYPHRIPDEQKHVYSCHAKPDFSVLDGGEIVAHTSPHNYMDRAILISPKISRMIDVRSDPSAIYNLLVRGVAPMTGSALVHRLEPCRPGHASDLAVRHRVAKFPRPRRPTVTRAGANQDQSRGQEIFRLFLAPRHPSPPSHILLLQNHELPSPLCLDCVHDPPACHRCRHSTAKISHGGYGAICRLTRRMFV